MNNKQKAEEFIIKKYKINEWYREDTEETRVYMSNDVHDEYEEEYKLFLAGLEEGGKELEKKNAELKATYKKQRNKRIDQLQKENAKLKKQNKSLIETLCAIATDTNEHITHNVAQNELDKWS